MNPTTHDHAAPATGGPPDAGPFARFDPRVRLLAALAVVVVAVTTPPPAFAAFGGYVLLLAAACAAARVRPGYVLRRLAVAAPLVLLAGGLIPFLAGGEAAFRLGPLTVYRDGLLTLWSVAAKATVAVVAMSLLAATTPTADLLGGLRRLGAPAALVTTLGLTERYLHVLADQAARMARARDLRCYGGRWLWQAGVMGRMVGTLFVRSYERGERVHAAMLCRGYDGSSPDVRIGPLHLSDVLFPAAAVAAFILLRVAL